jgi:PAS domain S-box-containing protein
MNESTFIGLANNAALLVALGLVFDTVVLKPGYEKTYVKILTGIIFGILGIAVMMTPWEFIPGVIFDTRSVILSIGGLFFGILPTLIAMLMTGALRIFQGGIGAWTGTAVIITSGIFGILWRHKRKRVLDNISLVELYIFGIVVHIAMLLWMLSLPWAIAKSVLSNISLPVMILYPTGTLLLGKLMIARLKRKKDRDALSHSEARWRSLTGNSPDHILTLDNNLNIQFANFAAPGLTVEELIGTPLHQYVEGENKQKEIKAILESVLKTGEQKTYETEYDIPDGGTIYYETRAVPRRLESSKDIVGLTVSSRNITERKESEKMLEESEERYRGIVEDTPVLVCNFKPDYAIEFVNSAYCSLFEMTYEELIGKSILSLIPEKDRETVTRNISSLAIDSPVMSHEHQVILPDGNTGWQEWVNRVFFDKNGEAAYFQSVGIDITDRKMAEKELLESEIKYRALFDNAPIMMHSINNEGNLIEVNQMWIKTLGYKREEALGKASLSFLTKESREYAFSEMFPEFYEKGYVKDIYYQFIKKNGEIVDVMLSAISEKSETGEIIRSTAILEDITEKKKLEEEKRQHELEKQKIIEILGLINASKSIDDLAKIVTTEIKELSKVEAVGLRFRAGEDYPYYTTTGFTKEFVLAENSLCVTDINGQILKDQIGNPVLECMCGNIISGRFDPNFPFFTEFGSFWANCTSDLLANTTESDRQARTRNRCNGEGYESVALIPLKARDEIFGLIQLNDFKKNMFSHQSINSFERIASNIANAIENFLVNEKIKFALKEKETLLHEIHHRVKNNMQVINSLLKLQSNNIEDKRIKEILKDSQSRVYAMSAVHETLHGSEKLSEIDLKTYLSKITTSIFQTYSTDHRKIKLNSNITESPISINQAYPLGLVINELISNAMKYAFLDDRTGEISVSMQRHDKELELIVMDNGIGMPKGLDWKNSKSLGLKLVRTLAENQLDGSIEMECYNGTKFTIKFNIET